MTKEALSEDFNQFSTNQPPVGETDQVEAPPIDGTTTQPTPKIIPHDHHLGEN